MEWEPLTDKDLSEKAESGRTGQGSVVESMRRLRKNIEGLSTILVTASKESAETADKNLEMAKINLRFQKGLMWLTVLILVVTVGVGVVTFLQLFLQLKK